MPWSMSCSSLQVGQLCSCLLWMAATICVHPFWEGLPLAMIWAEMPALSPHFLPSPFSWCSVLWTLKDSGLRSVSSAQGDARLSLAPSTKPIRGATLRHTLFLILKYQFWVLMSSVLKFVTSFKLTNISISPGRRINSSYLEAKHALTFINF